MSTRQSWLKLLGEAESRLALVKRDRALATNKRAYAVAELQHRRNALEFFTRTANTAQQRVAEVISTVVTSALQVVYDDGYEFKVSFVTRRNSTEADLILLRRGNEVDPLGNSGLGVANIIAITLRAAFILMDGTKRRLMILDEPTAALMIAKQSLAGQVLQTLCKKLGFQILLTTHHPDLAECADKVYHVSMDSKGKSSVKELEDKSEIRTLMELE